MGVGELFVFLEEANELSFLETLRAEQALFFLFSVFSVAGLVLLGLVEFFVLFIEGAVIVPHDFLFFVPHDLRGLVFYDFQVLQDLLVVLQRFVVELSPTSCQLVFVVLQNEAVLSLHAECPQVNFSNPLLQLT